MRVLPAIAIALTLYRSTAAAQDAGATVGASIGVTDISGRTELTFSGSAGYRFNRIVGLELEVTATPTLKSAFPTSQVTVQSVSAGSGFVSTAIYPPVSYNNLDGRAVFFTNNVRVELPTSTARLTPYFVAGGGVATVRRSADLTIPVPVPLPLSPLGGIPIQLRPIVQPVSTSSTDLALTIGGGISVGVSSHVSVDGDLRFFRLMGDADQNAGRFGVGVRYRF